MNITPTYTLIAVTSADGFIAAEANQHSFSWNSDEDKTHFMALLKRMDVNIIGNTSYTIHKNEMAKYPCICLTRSVTEPIKKTDTLTYLNPEVTNLRQFIAKLDGVKHVGILGGAQVYSTCMDLGLVDDIFQTIEPVYFGSGVPLFQGLTTPHRLVLNTLTPLNQSGTLLAHYQRNKR